MKIITLEALKPGLHSFRTQLISPPGEKRKVYRGNNYIATPSGTMLEDEWVREARNAIHLLGGDQLLSEIKAHCRRHFVWLRTEKELEQYSMECMLERAYEYWEKDPDETFSEYPHKIGFVFDKYDDEKYQDVLSQEI